MTHAGSLPTVELMTLDSSITASTGRYVRANGIDIYYVEAGAGPPLVLLHGGLVSTSPMWDGHPFAYVSHMAKLAQHFRVIAPECRGCARTTHPGGTISYSQLADDVAAFIQALSLDRPMIAGFSDGGIQSALVGIRHPGSVRAIINHAGHDVFNPSAPTFSIMRGMLGGSPEATKADPEAAMRGARASEEMRASFDIMRADQDRAQGPNYWKTYLTLAFDRTTRSPGYTLVDFREISVPTLILVGDRDGFCSVEEGVQAYRMLSNGELAVLPNTGHYITPYAIDAMIEFLERQPLPEDA